MALVSRYDARPSRNLPWMENRPPGPSSARGAAYPFVSSSSIVAAAVESWRGLLGPLFRDAAAALPDGGARQQRIPSLYMAILSSTDRL